MGRSTVVMLQMMATLKSEESLIEDAIKSLQEYKDGTFKEGARPFAELMLLIIKWEQDPNDSPMDIMDKAMKDSAIVEKAVKISESEKEETVPEEHKSDDDDEPQTILMGESGKA